MYVMYASIKLISKYILYKIKLEYIESTNKFPPFAKDGATNKL